MIPSSWPGSMTSLASLVLSGNMGLCGPAPSPWLLTGPIITATTGTTRLGQTCPDPQIQADNLRIISSQLGNQAVLTSAWSDNNPCGPPTWLNITCIGGLVTGIDLSNTVFTGQSMPAGVTAFTGLESLKLANAGLTGTIPVEWSILTTLTLIDIQNNALTGTLPAQWDVLTRIKVSLRCGVFFCLFLSHTAKGCGCGSYVCTQVLSNHIETSGRSSFGCLWSDCDDN